MGRRRYGPGSMAPVLLPEGGKIAARLQNWGIPLSDGKRVINARAEIVGKHVHCSKKIFCSVVA